MTVLVVLWQISLEKDEHCTVIDNSDAERWIVSIKKKLNNIVLLLFLFLLVSRELFKIPSYLLTLSFSSYAMPWYTAAKIQCPSLIPNYTVQFLYSC